MFLQSPISHQTAACQQITQTTMPTSALLDIQSLGFSYPGRELFTDLSVSIKPGVTLVQGGDGLGKTTLLRLLSGELKPSSGQLKINSKVFWVDPRSEAFDQLTGNQFFETQRLAFPEFDYALVKKLVNGLDLASHINKKLFMLSTGSRRKVYIAAAVASGATVTLIDMPFAAVDKPSINFIIELLHEAAEKTDRAFVVADYEAPSGVRLAGVIDLGD
jgi:ABC-type multidrug transport system ATPase subunit